MTWQFNKTLCGAGHRRTRIGIYAHHTLFCSCACVMENIFERISLLSFLSKHCFYHVVWLLWCFFIRCVKRHNNFPYYQIYSKIYFLFAIEKGDKEMDNIRSMLLDRGFFYFHFIFISFCFIISFIYTYLYNVTLLVTGCRKCYMT